MLPSAEYTVLSFALLKPQDHILRSLFMAAMAVFVGLAMYVKKRRTLCCTSIRS